MVSEYVANPPGAAVADELPPEAMARVKSETTCETVELVKVENWASPPYAAVSECVPMDRLDVTYVAVPEASVPEPRRVVPS